jgi:hypothetical protein
LTVARGNRVIRAATPSAHTAPAGERDPHALERPRRRLLKLGEQRRDGREAFARLGEDMHEFVGVPGASRLGRQQLGARRDRRR